MSSIIVRHAQAVGTTLTSLGASAHLRYSLWRARGDLEALKHMDRAATQAPDGSPDPDGEAGMATAEYAIGTVAAAAFAGILLAVLRSGSVKGLVQGLIETALSL